MKATGIVRRIDDLGRVVIPKEIRRTMRIREGDPLEIFIASDNSGIILKRYHTGMQDDLENIRKHIVDNVHTNDATKVTDYFNHIYDILEGYGLE